MSLQFHFLEFATVNNNSKNVKKMGKRIRSINETLGGMVTSVSRPKCETCSNDASGCNCVKISVYGNRELCITHSGL